MKKILSVVLVCVMLVGMMCTLASCGTRLSGTYECEKLNTTIEFKGKDFTMTTEIPFVGDVVRTGTYEITGEEGDREIVFTFEEDGEEETETSDLVIGEGKKYIEIDGVKFEKAE